LTGDEVPTPPAPLSRAHVRAPSAEPPAGFPPALSVASTNGPDRKAQSSGAGGLDRVPGIFPHRPGDGTEGFVTATAASGYARRRCGGTFRELGYVGETPGTTCASHPRRDARCRWGHVRQEPMVRGLSAGGEWIRNFSSSMPRHRQQRGRLHFGEWLLREPPKQLYRFGEADDRSGDSPAPTVDRPQPDRSLKTAAYLARN